MLCTQARDCPPEQSEGTQNLRTEIFHYVQNDKSVGRVILCSVILTVGKDLKIIKFNIILQFSTLNYYLIFILQSFFLNFSSREKLQKRPTQNKISHNSLLLTSCKQHSSVGCYLT